MLCVSNPRGATNPPKSLRKERSCLYSSQESKLTPRRYADRAKPNPLLLPLSRDETKPTVNLSSCATPHASPPPQVVGEHCWPPPRLPTPTNSTVHAPCFIPSHPLQESLLRVSGNALDHPTYNPSRRITADGPMWLARDTSENRPASLSQHTPQAAQPWGTSHHWDVKIAQDCWLLKNDTRQRLCCTSSLILLELLICQGRAVEARGSRDTRRGGHRRDDKYSTPAPSIWTHQRTPSHSSVLFESQIRA